MFHQFVPARTGSEDDRDMTRIIKAAITKAWKIVEVAGGLGVESDTLRPHQSTSNSRD